MPRCVHEVQLVLNPVIGFVGKADGLRLDGNAAFLFNVHVVEDLLGHLARFQPAAGLNQTVGEGGFAMVNMRDNREVADLG